jgi:hypothetical protein
VKFTIIRNIYKIAAVAALLIGIAPGSPSATPALPNPRIDLNFDELTGGMAATAEGSPIPSSARISTQYASAYGVKFSSGSSYAALVTYSQLGMTTSGYNALGGSTPSGNLTYDSDYPLVATFVDPSNPSEPGVTDYVSVRGDNLGTHTTSVSLKAYDIKGNLLVVSTQTDSGGETLAVSGTGIHSVQFVGNHGSGIGVSIDDFTFGVVKSAIQPEIVLQNSVSSQGALWRLDNTGTVTYSNVLSSIPPTGWYIVGKGDFNSDGQSDLVLQNNTTHQIAIWYLTDTTLIGGGYVSATLPTNWGVVAVGDFNGDGKPDLVLQNATTNQVALWYLNGTTLIGGGYISATPPAGWHVVGQGDANGDHKPDLFLQNTSTNQVAVWYLNGLALTGGAYLSATPPAGWRVAGVGDFNGDGKPDLVLQSSADNTVALWYLNGVTLTGGGYTSMAPPQGWLVVVAR